MHYDIKKDLDKLSVNMQQLVKSLSSVHILKRAGLEVAVTAQNKAFAKKGRSFWRNIGLSVSTQTKGNAVYVGATHVAAAQKQFGGPITAPGKGEGAVGAKALTIPIGEARKERWDVDKAKNKFNIFSIKTKSGKGMLFGELKTPSKNQNIKPVPLFLLRKRVVQKPDPWFPEGAELKRAISRGIADYLREQ